MALCIHSFSHVAPRTLTACYFYDLCSLKHKQLHKLISSALPSFYPQPSLLNASIHLSINPSIPLLSNPLPRSFLLLLLSFHTPCCTDLPPAGWGVYLDVAPSAWRSRARQSERTTSPSSCPEGLCTGHLAGWTGCGSSAAAGSWPPRTVGPVWAGLGSAGLFLDGKKIS